MLSIPRKYIVDDAGNRKEVIIAYEDFRLIEELLGLDLEEDVVTILKEASRDRAYKAKETYIELDDLS
ncbi:MAG: hypothetical protein KA362_20075 [Chloroflexi bacterium]|jgi:hypothetical protein|nr:hypothetical protein [Chloroflexota bacterium]MBK6711747.1 hypothetical protein [Chloroflexota bacterium]MBK7180145.1 hypothetical protein [Chloroflexota bacterium]MBK7920195.1 hypothetical protein [Chloroflexota bacterium]MBK8931570.1 hypothetical protein [Chloroflexota bacterium]